MLHLNGEMVSYGDGGLRLFYYATETFGDFTLRLQFKIFDPAKHNSGVFVRFPRPTLRPRDCRIERRAANETAFDPGNPAWRPVIAGFEVQIDDNAIGDGTKDFYGIRPEPNGLFKNRTGAIYKIQAGDRVWHLGMNEPAVQNYTPAPPSYPASGSSTKSWCRAMTTRCFSPIPRPASAGRRHHFIISTASVAARPASSACRHIQATRVAWRHIRIRT